MADIVQVPSTVKASTEGLRNKVAGMSGAAFDAGDTLYGAADGRLLKGDVNAVSPAHDIKGVALCSCPGADQPCWYAKKDNDFIPGGPTVEGKIYVGSVNPGKICPVEDLAAGSKTVYIGTGKAGNKLDLFVRSTGIAVPP